MFIINKENRITAKELYPKGPAWVTIKTDHWSASGIASYGLHVGDEPGLLVAIADKKGELIDYAKYHGWDLRE